MTDNEIIKALECCSKSDTEDNYCDGCPYEKEKYCASKISKDSLDLINRLQAEIKSLERENDILSIIADTAFQDGLNEAQDLYAEQVNAEIKTEAIKEFAERLKEQSDSHFDYSELVFEIGEEKIDNLVKEMEGEDK